MVQAILDRIKIRAIIVAVIIHLGLIAAVVGLSILPHPDGLEAGHWLAIGGVAGVYGGMVLGILMVVLPLASTIRRVRKLLQWREWILAELPRIISLLPQVLEAIRAFFESLAKGGTVQSAMGEAARQASPTPAPSSDVPAPKPPHEAA